MGLQWRWGLLWRAVAAIPSLLGCPQPRVAYRVAVAKLRWRGRAEVARSVAGPSGRPGWRCAIPARRRSARPGRKRGAGPPRNGLHQAMVPRLLVDAAAWPDPAPAARPGRPDRRGPVRLYRVSGVLCERSRPGPLTGADLAAASRMDCSPITPTAQPSLASPKTSRPTER
jgi:hypothetical protein